VRFYALEVKLVEVTCRCKSHPSGLCMSVKTQTRQDVRKAHIGSFGFDIHSLAEALRKWDSIINKGQVLDPRD